MLGDVIDAAQNLRRGTHASIGSLVPADIRPMDELRSAYYLSIDVVDRAGVLRAVAEILERHRVSVHSMEQVDLDDEARLLFITHQARESDVQAVLADLEALDEVERVGT